LKTLAAPAARVPPIRVKSSSSQVGQPSAASIIAGTVVTSRSSMIRGLVSARYAPTRARTADGNRRAGAAARSERAVTGSPPANWTARDPFEGGTGTASL
jgi:hypothetical protein